MTVSEALTGTAHGDTLGGLLLAAVRLVGRTVSGRRTRARRLWMRIQTEREISKLPPEIRKDIGWPTRRDD